MKKNQQSGAFKTVSEDALCRRVIYLRVLLTLTDERQICSMLTIPRILTSMRELLEQNRMQFNQEQAVVYHYDQFPPEELDYTQIVEPLLKATDALARYDQMLKGCMNVKYYWLRSETRKLWYLHESKAQRVTSIRLKLQR